jgi:hypothetical protein
MFEKKEKVIIDQHGSKPGLQGRVFVIKWNMLLQWEEIMAPNALRMETIGFE